MTDLHSTRDNRRFSLRVQRGHKSVIASGAWRSRLSNLSKPTGAWPGSSAPYWALKAAAAEPEYSSGSAQRHWQVKVKPRLKRFDRAKITARHIAGHRSTLVGTGIFLQLVRSEQVPFEIFTAGWVAAVCQRSEEHGVVIIKGIHICSEWPKVGIINKAVVSLLHACHVSAKTTERSGVPNQVESTGN